MYLFDFFMPKTYNYYVKTLIVAPRSFHPYLLKKYRQDNPFSDIKIVSKEELIKQWKGSVELGADKYLIKKYLFSYEIARTIIPYLPYVNEKLEELFKIKEDLISQGLLVKNEYLKTFFLDKEIKIFGYSQKDKELASLLKEFKLSYTFANPSKKELNQKINIYETCREEVFSCLNNIASLLNQGVDINNIYIYVNDNSYRHYIETYSSSFGFQTDLKDEKPLTSYLLTKRFIDNYSLTRNVQEALFDIEDAEDKDLYQALKEVVDSAIDENFSYEQQLDYFVGKLSSTTYHRLDLNNVVRIIDTPIFLEKSYVFVLGFAQGNFPPSFKDDEYLNDNKKELIGMNTSLEKTEIAQEMMLSFLSSNNHFFFSRSTRSLDSSYIDSPWNDELNLQKEYPKLSKTFFSNDMINFYFFKNMDLKINYRVTSSELISLSGFETVSYSSFDNQFDGVSVFNEKEKMIYSYTQINSFYQCPFSYYLDRVLQVDTFEGNYNTMFGSLAHEIFERTLDDNFDFDSSFESLLKQYDFSIEERPIVINLKEDLRKACLAIIEHRHYMTNPKFITEKNILSQIAENTYITGKIDKSIILDNKYLVLVDYKTGKTSFSDKYLVDGVDMQLPTYLILANDDDTLKSYSVVGLFLQGVINTSLSYSPRGDSLIDSYLKLEGKIVGEQEIISLFDSTFTSGQSEFVKSLKMNKNGSIRAASTISSFEQFEGFKNIVKEKYLEADKRIRNNEFPINPLYISKQSYACKYCEYKDICFVKSSQRRYLSNNEDEEEDENDE